MTPRAPTLETTSCWKPDSIQARARDEFGVDPVHAGPVVEGRAHGVATNGAGAGVACGVRTTAPRGSQEHLPGDDHVHEREAVCDGRVATGSRCNEPAIE